MSQNLSAYPETTFKGEILAKRTPSELVKKYPSEILMALKSIPVHISGDLYGKNVAFRHGCGLHVPRNGGNRVILLGACHIL